MARYRATDIAVYLCDQGRMVFVGEEFSFDGPAGSTWEPIDDAAKAACKAAFPEKYPDEAPAKGRKAPADLTDG